ncbi:translation machinery-associated protein 16 [Daktulosphaira vitifoliae]|uniref:translation machinery-associated protein 16 n=1 Tax=Daktulosphaira vitifoliae TaxID=58002 RepID=UPI0021AA5F23|nr:translation machinery-associated protein 16 [Daktulosphaira vitifoliae]
MGKPKPNIMTVNHPNSRKTKQLIKSKHKTAFRDKKKLNNLAKPSLLCEKLIWFRDNVDNTISQYTPELLAMLIEKYLKRFDNELNLIQAKHKDKINRRYASREDVIRLTVDREREEYLTAGIEVPSIFNAEQLLYLRTWDGDIRFLPNFRIIRFSCPK